MLSHPSYKRGFSLIELMVAVAILAILLTAVLPSFKAWIQNAKIRTATESLKNGLQLARVEAIRRNQGVIFSLVGTDSTWSVDTIATAAASSVQIQSRSSAEGSSTVTLIATGGTTATFNGLGRTVGTGLTKIDVVNNILTSTEMKKLRILISSGGQIRSCDPDPSIPSTDTRSC
ncbi:MAG: GspH/FimT family pseudopilin [Gallionellaceae bacterium]